MWAIGKFCTGRSQTAPERVHVPCSARPAPAPSFLHSLKLHRYYAWKRCKQIILTQVAAAATLPARDWLRLSINLVRFCSSSAHPTVLPHYPGYFTYNLVGIGSDEWRVAVQRLRSIMDSGLAGSGRFGRGKATRHNAATTPVFSSIILASTMMPTCFDKYCLNSRIF